MRLVPLAPARPRLAGLLLLLAGCPDKDPIDTASSGSSAATSASTGDASTSAATGTASTGDATTDVSGTLTSGGPTTTGSTTDGPPPAVECTQDSDCVLIDNCCECDAKSASEPVDECMIDCPGTKCGLGLQLGIEVACRSGLCEFAQVRCLDQVACDAKPPACPPGTIPSVDGACWGPCVEPVYCIDVTCNPDEVGGCGPGWTCVEHQAGAAHCELLPAACGGVASCACLEPFFSEFCGGPCGDDGGKILCMDGG